MKSLFLATALALTLPMVSIAQQAPLTPQEKGLSAPVIGLTPVLAKNADALGLNDDQKADLKAFLDTMPAKRMAMEDEAAAMRAEMTSLIAAGAPEEERQALADKIGQQETALIMMRSHCADHWRSVLTADQFAQLLQLASVN